MISIEKEFPMRQAWKMICLLSLLALFTGCANVAMIPVQTMKPMTEFPYDGVVLDIAPATAEDTREQTNDLEIYVAKAIGDIEQIPEVRLAHPEVETGNALLVKVAVKGIRKVSGTARFFLGAFAGSASMNTEVTFIDGPTDELLGIYEITGKSGSSGMSGGTDDAVVQTADGIVDIICESFGVKPPKDRSKESVGYEDEF